MAELTSVQLAGLITLAMLITGAAVGTLTYNPETTMYCPSRDLVMDCSEGVSGTRCNYLDDTQTKKYKLCSEGWKPIGDYLQNRIKLNATRVDITKNDIGFNARIKIYNNTEYICVLQNKVCVEKTEYMNSDINNNLMSYNLQNKQVESAGDFFIYNNNSICKEMI